WSSTAAPFQMSTSARSARRGAGLVALILLALALLASGAWAAEHDPADALPRDLAPELEAARSTIGWPEADLSQLESLREDLLTLRTQNIDAQRAATGNLQ